MKIHKIGLIIFTFFSCQFKGSQDSSVKDHIVKHNDKNYVVFYDLDIQKLLLGVCNNTDYDQLKNLYHGYLDLTDEDKMKVWTKSKQNPCHKQVDGSISVNPSIYLDKLFFLLRLELIDTSEIEGKIANVVEKIETTSTQKNDIQTLIDRIKSRLTNLEKNIEFAKISIETLKNLKNQHSENANSEQLAILEKSLNEYYENLIEIEKENNLAIEELENQKVNLSNINLKITNLNNSLNSLNQRFNNILDSDPNLKIRKLLTNALDGGKFKEISENPNLLVELYSKIFSRRIMFIGHNGSKTYYAIDAVNGSILWKKAFPNFFGQPGIIEPGVDEVFIYNNQVIFNHVIDNYLYSYNVKSGEKIQEYEVENDYLEKITTAFQDDTLVVSQNKYVPGTTHNKQTGFTYAFDSKTGEKKWKVNRGSFSPILTSQRIYFREEISPRSFDGLRAYDLSNGNEINDVYDTFQYQYDSMDSLYYNKNYIYVQDSPYLFAYNIHTGKRIWIKTISGILTVENFKLSEGNFYLPVCNNEKNFIEKFIKIDEHTGAISSETIVPELYQKKISCHRSRFEIIGNTLFLSDGNIEKFLTLDLNSGKENWNIDAEKFSLFSKISFQLIDDSIYFLDGNTLYSYDKQTGQKNWQITIEGDSSLVSGVRLLGSYGFKDTLKVE